MLSVDRASRFELCGKYRLVVGLTEPFICPRLCMVLAVLGALLHTLFLFFTSTWTLLEEVPYYSPIRGRRMWESCYSWEMKVSAFSFSAYAEVKKGQLQRWEKLISNTSAVWELCLPLFSVYCRLCPPNPSPRLVMNNKWKNTLSSYFYPQLFGFSRGWIYF